MANFFKRGKKIIISVEADDLKDSGNPLRSALKEAFPLEQGFEMLINIGICNEVSLDAVSVLASFAKECRRSNCIIKLTTTRAVNDQLAMIGLDRHFQVLNIAS